MGTPEGTSLNIPTVRLFIAYMMPPEFQQKIRHWRLLHMHLPVRWISPENLHITIIPPWHETSPEKVKKLLQTPLISPSFSLPFSDIGPGPTPNNPRLLWTTARATNPIISLKELLQSRLKQPEDKHQFIPHITLGKLFLNQDKHTDFPPFVSHFSWTEHISSIQLVQSFLHQEGAEYRVLQSIALHP